MIDPLHRTIEASLSLTELQARIQQTEPFGFALTDIVAVTFDDIPFNAVTFVWKKPNPGPYTSFVAGSKAPAAATFSVTRQVFVSGVSTQVTAYR